MRISDRVLKGVERAPQRSLFYAAGFTEEELHKPLIGIVSAQSEIIPGHIHLSKLAEAVKAGVYATGGTPVVVPAIGVCDGIDIDLENYTIHARVSEEEFEKRRREQVIPESWVRGGWLSRYRKLVSSAAEGAVLK